MSDSGSWAQAQALRQLFDQLSDAILLLDAQARISFANIAALRALSCEPGMPVDQLRAALATRPSTGCIHASHRTGSAEHSAAMPTRRSSC
jgi:PAS domain-containing protein